MENQLSIFQKIKNTNNVFCATKGNLRCTAIKLSDNSLCIFSPVSGLSKALVDNIKSLGSVSVLFAPNHYHNQGLSEYKAAFPEAVLVASEEARLRLTKITSLEFQSLESLIEKLPSNTELISTLGLKTGECWIKVKSEKYNTWIVVDAFCTKAKNKQNEFSSEPEILGTFPKFGVKDKSTYLPWLEAQIKCDQPKMIIPCHGSLIFDEKLPEKLQCLVDKDLKG